MKGRKRAIKETDVQNCVGKVISSQAGGGEGHTYGVGVERMNPSLAAASVPSNKKGGSRLEDKVVKEMAFLNLVAMSDTGIMNTIRFIILYWLQCRRVIFRVVILIQVTLSAW